MWAMVKGKLQKCNSEARNFYTLARQMEEKLPKKGTGGLGDSVVGHLECKKPVPLWRKAKHAQRYPAWSNDPAAGVPGTLQDVH